MTGFQPPRWLRGRHAQTVWGSLFRLPVRLPLRHERWELPDGDFIDIEVVQGASVESPVVVVCHGLEGSAKAGYVRGLLYQLSVRGLGAIAVNFRGCSGEPNRLPRFYHSGDTGDLGFVIDRLIADRPERAIALAGFSLGGNVVAKYLGERGDEVPRQVRAGAVVSVPFDLAMCAGALDGGGLMARVYRGRFLRRLRAKVAAKARAHPTVPAAAANAARTFRDFDHGVTAPLHGFQSAEDYWAKSSAGPFLPSVRRPLLIVAAEDDPFVPAEALPRAAAKANPNLTLEVSREGGHVAFVHGPPWAPRRHAEQRVAQFLADALR
ncbi:MAG: Alpha/beta hydrolase fold [Myxococcales bacterium]|nr:Alpha/beta hydrolase fold [Myxococcales bacterium]